MLEELRHENAPEAVRAWAANPPRWLAVYENPPGMPLPYSKLQAGEQAAILLAEAVEAEIVVIDEKVARRVAEDRELRVTGTLGVLGDAGLRGIVDLPHAIDRLRGTSFRCSPALLKRTMDLYGQR